MRGLILLIAATALIPGDVEPGHAVNAAYQDALGTGLVVEGESLRPSSPSFFDGQPADERRATLKAISGSARKAEAMLQDLDTAPHVLKLSESKSKAGASLWKADVWFLVHASLDVMDDAFRPVEKPEPVDVAGLRFDCQLLDARELKPRKIDPARPTKTSREWYVHRTGRLLDRLLVATTDRLTTTRTPESLVAAWKTATVFDGDDRIPNCWRKLLVGVTKKRDSPGPARPFAGWSGYAKMSKWEDDPNLVMVEVHFVFVEPPEWAELAPGLKVKPKLGAIVQEEVRRLRREVARAKGGNSLQSTDAR